MNLVVNKSQLAELLEQADSLLPGISADAYLNKVEVDRNLDLSFEVVNGATHRWFDWTNGTAVELVISEDRKIPLASQLKLDAFTAKARLLSYRPGRRLTLLDKSGHKPRVLKGFRSTHLDKMIAHYEFAHRAFAGSGVNAPSIIEYDYDKACLVMVYEDGERLRLSSDSSDIFHQVGEALRGFQDCTSEHDSLVFSSADELGVIDKRAGRLLKVADGLPEGWNALRQRLESAHDKLPAAKVVHAHRDLHDKQFILHDCYLTLLDFDLICKADTALDPANFLAHLVLRNLQMVRGATQKSIDLCGKQFLQGLDHGDEPGFWERLRFYQATTFCRLSLVYELRPRWTHLVPDLVTMGNRCLDDLERINRQ